MGLGLLGVELGLGRVCGGWKRGLNRRGCKRDRGERRLGHWDGSGRTRRVLSSSLSTSLFLLGRARFCLLEQTHFSVAGHRRFFWGFFICESLCVEISKGPKRSYGYGVGRGPDQEAKKGFNLEVKLVFLVTVSLFFVIFSS